MWNLIHNIKKELIFDWIKRVVEILVWFLLSYYWLYFVIILWNFYAIFSVIIIIIGITYFLLRKYGIGLHKTYKIGLYVLVPFITIICLYYIFIEQKTVHDLNIRYIHNKAVAKESAITQNNIWYTLNKNPVEKHPYIGIFSIGELANQNKIYVTMKWKLNGPSWLGIVFTNKETFPTEYIELKASISNGSKLWLNLIDGKSVTPLLSQNGEIYEWKDFEIGLSFDKKKNEVCIYQGLFSRNCKNIPNTTTFNYLWFKLTDDDIWNNNPYVPEMKEFKIYTPRY